MGGKRISLNHELNPSRKICRVAKREGILLEKGRGKIRCQTQRNPLRGRKEEKQRRKRKNLEHVSCYIRFSSQIPQGERVGGL